MKISNSDAINLAAWEAPAPKQFQNTADTFQNTLNDQIKISDEGKVLSQSSKKAPEILLSNQEKLYFNDVFNTPVYSSVALSDSELSYFNRAFSAPAAYSKNGAALLGSSVGGSISINI